MAWYADCRRGKCEHPARSSTTQCFATLPRAPGFLLFRSQEDRYPGTSSADSPRIARYHRAGYETIPCVPRRRDGRARIDMPNQEPSQVLTALRATAIV